MADGQLKLFKGTQSQLNTINNGTDKKISDGNLIVAKNDTSLTGNLYIDYDNNKRIKLSDDNAYVKGVYNEGVLTLTKMNGTTENILSVDNILNKDSKNPIQNKAVTSTLNTHTDTINSHSETLVEHNEAISTLQQDVDNVEKNISEHINPILDTLDRTIRDTAADEINTLIDAADNPDTIEDINSLVQYVNDNAGDIAALIDEVNGKAAASDVVDLENRVTGLENNKVTSANQITYSNASSGLVATNIQSAIDELNTKTQSPYSASFIAEYNVTPVEAVIDAYNKGLEIIVKRTQPYVIPVTHYARLARVEGNDVNPILIFTCEENLHSHHYYIDKEGWRYWYDNLGPELFIAQYGMTSFAEIQKALTSGQDLICKYGTNIANLDIFASDYAQFSGLDTDGNPVLLKVTQDDVWTRTHIQKANQEYVDKLNSRVLGLANGLSDVGKYIAGQDDMISALDKMDAVSILQSAYNFRGGFVNNAGTLHITHPGIYLIIQGGTNNKNIIIKDRMVGNNFLNKTWNGIVLMAYENGAVTPIGIKDSLTLLGAFELPGTYQGWGGKNNRYSTTITYPKGCVIAYLGNRDVNYLE